MAAAENRLARILALALDGTAVVRAGAPGERSSFLSRQAVGVRLCCTLFGPVRGGLMMYAVLRLAWPTRGRRMWCCLLVIFLPGRWSGCARGALTGPMKTHRRGSLVPAALG